MVYVLCMYVKSVLRLNQNFFGTVYVCVGVLVVFWIFYPHVMCKLFHHFLSKLLGCCTMSLCATVSAYKSFS